MLHTFNWILGVISTTLIGVATFVWVNRKVLFPSSISEESVQRSVEISKEPEHEGETTIRRYVESPDKLIATPEEGIETPYDLIQQAFQRFTNEKAMGYRPLLDTIVSEKEVGPEGKKEKKKWTYFKQGDYQWITYKELRDRISLMSKGLCSLELSTDNANRRFAIYCDTCPEWMMMCQACWSQSIVVVTAYANLGEDALTHALRETDISCIFTFGDLLEMLSKVMDNCPKLRTVIYKGDAKEQTIKSLQERGITLHTLKYLEDLGRDNQEVKDCSPRRDTLANIMYTSGSSGAPKGVMITHGNLLATIAAAKKAVGDASKIGPEDIYIGYLPLAHVLELILQLVVLSSGVAVGYSSPKTLTDQNMRDCKGDLRELRPTLMPGVPTVWEKVKQGAIANINKLNPIIRTLFWLSFKMKKRALLAGMETPLLDRLIFDKLKQQIGGRVRLTVTAGAPLSSEVHWFIRVCFCHPVVQVYGLTETCGAGAYLPIDHLATERIGVPLPSVELKLVDASEMKYFTSNDPPRGEIWIRGPSVTSGYFNMEKKTKEVFKEGGWFRTEDIGQLHPDGTFSVIDRMSNLIKLSHGEYVAVEKIESKYKNCEMVEQIMVYGDSSKPYPIALVVPAKKALKSWASNNLGSMDFQKICETEEASKAVLESLNRCGRESGLKSIEMVKAILLIKEPWTVENGRLTAAQKLKRKDIIQEYKVQIDKIYQNTRSSE